MSAVPLNGYLHRLLHPAWFSSSVPVQVAGTLLDYAALAGIGWALIWAAVLLRRRQFGAVPLGIYAFAGLTIFLWHPDAWSEAYAFGRSLTPLLLLLALLGIQTRRLTLTGPLLLVTVRTSLVLLPALKALLVSGAIWRQQ